MKKRQAGSKVLATTKRPAPKLLPEVVERVGKLRRVGKSKALTEIETALVGAPNVEIVALDGTKRTTSETFLRYVVSRNDATFAWMHVAATIEALATDPKVAKSAVAVEFVRVVAEVARNSVLADSAAEAIRPLHEMLTKPGANKGSKTAKTLLYLSLRDRFPSWGPKRLAEYISMSVGKHDPAVDLCFRVDEDWQLIDREQRRAVTVEALAEQIKKALQRAKG